MAIPGLARGTRSRIYARVVDQLTTDPILSKLFAKRWDVGYARPGFQIATLGNEPYIRLTPTLSQQEWYSPTSQAGFLEIQFDIWLPGNSGGAFDVLDSLDAWEVVERCLFNPDKAKRQAFKLELEALGATTGEFKISMPSQIAQADKGVANIGRVRLEIKRNLS